MSFFFLALFSGVILGLFLPDSFKKPYSTFLPGKSLFTERELHILRSRVLLDDPMKGKKKKKIGLAAFKKAVSRTQTGKKPTAPNCDSTQLTPSPPKFTNWRLYLHFLITLCNNGPQRAFDTYSPSIVSSFGFADLTSNALASVGLFIQIPVSFAFSWVSDRFGRRGETVLTGLSCHLIAYIMNRGFTELVGLRGVQYFGVVWTQTFATFSVRLFILPIPPQVHGLDAQRTNPLIC